MSEPTQYRITIDGQQKWFAHRGGDEGWCAPECRTGRHDGPYIGTLSELVQKHPLGLKYHESLPVGRASPQLERL